MATVSELMYQHYKIRREVSRPPDLVTLLLARLMYQPVSRLPASVNELVQKLETGTFDSGSLSGSQTSNFSDWLRGYLTILKTVRGASYYPVHPLLSLPSNGEGSRVQSFIDTLAAAFTPAERQQLLEALWSDESLPPFEKALHDLLDWAKSPDASLLEADDSTFAGIDDQAPALSPDGIIAGTKADLLALAEITVGVQSFTIHAGRLLAFAIARYLLVQAGLSLDSPIYAAPAADSHEGVKTLAHEIIETHRAEFEQSLHQQFDAKLTGALAEEGIQGTPPDETTAQQLIARIFHYNARVVPTNEYAYLIEEYGSFNNLAYYYYWSRRGAQSRFLRQLHSTHLNMAKKAGFANSRSRYSQWHFYWLAPSLVETLLLVSQHRLNTDRILVDRLLKEWRQRYGLAVLIDPAWEAIYRKNFRALGSPEALNEANRRRFTEILAERGRLHKNSDDFPWVILRD